MINTLTKFIEPVKNGEFYMKEDSEGFPVYSSVAEELMNAVYQFVEENPQFNLTAYGNILDAAGIEISNRSFANLNIEEQPIEIVLAILVASVRAERVFEGSWYMVYESGVLLRALERLRALHGES